jgi:hypothetical protein
LARGFVSMRRMFSSESGFARFFMSPASGVTLGKPRATANAHRH